MKRLVVGIGLAGALVALCASVALGVGPSPFTGSWTSTDVDGSFQRIQIGGGDTVHIHYFDYGCSVCGVDEDGDPLYPCLGLGEATVDGDTLSGSMALWCLSKPRELYNEEEPVDLVYEATGDTLTGLGAESPVWSRTGDG